MYLSGPYVPKWNIWSKMVQEEKMIILKNQWWKWSLCPRKMGTKIFQNFIEVILAMKVKYAKTNHQILEIFEMCNLKVSNMINFNRN